MDGGETDTGREVPVPSIRHRRVTRWATLFIAVTVALGGMVCATDSSSACPAWPVCYADQVGPVMQAGWLKNPVIEFVHRAISFAALVLLGVSGWMGRRYADPRARVFPWVALACAIGSAVFAVPPGCAEGGFIGETLLGRRSVKKGVITAIFGSIVYASSMPSFSTQRSSPSSA